MPSEPVRPSIIATPPQRRGRDRVAQILSAAADLIDSAGGLAGRRGVTLRAIADAAGTSPATIYHYFPDLDSLFGAVAAKYGSDLSAAVQEALNPPAESLSEVIDVTMATYRRFFAARPGLREMWFDSRTSEQVDRVHRESRNAFADLMHSKLKAQSATKDDAFTYRVFFEIAGPLWEMSFQTNPDGDPRVLAEIREVSLRYLRRKSGEEPTAEQNDLADLRPVAIRCPLPDLVPDPSSGPLPPQARGRRRRAQILAAASHLIDTHGPHGAEVTIRSIADTAGAAPGSVYRYFEDLEDLVAAVAADYMNDLLAIGVEVDRAAPEDEDFSSFNTRNVAAYRTFFRQRPGLRALWFDRRASERIHQMHAQYRRLLAEQHRAILAGYLTSEGDLFEYTMHVEVLASLWNLAFTLDPTGDPAVILEIEELHRDFVRRRQGRSAPSGETG